DQLCMSGQLCWGRVLQPRDSLGEARKAGPIKSTPLNLLQRRNLDLWQALGSPAPGASDQGARASAAAASASDSAVPDLPGLSAVAAHVRGLLQQHGASFFHDLLRLTGLLAVQLEQA